MPGYDTSSATALVDPLERRDIARRSPHPTNRRRSVVGLTDHGHGVMTGLGRAGTKRRRSAVKICIHAFRCPPADIGGRR